MEQKKEKGHFEALPPRPCPPHAVVKAPTAARRSERRRTPGFSHSTERREREREACVGVCGCVCVHVGVWVCVCVGDHGGR